MPPGALFDVSQLDFGRVAADLEAIRRANQQRFEMEQLTAILHLDCERHLIIGYKDVS
jgi:3-hydroxyacyl-[acyl-carrier-protein] dehydratase